METLTEQARQLRNKYMRDYRNNRTEEVKEKHREYMRKWQRDNADKVRAARVRYWNKKAEQLKATEGGMK